MIETIDKYNTFISIKILKAYSRRLYLLHGRGGRAINYITNYRNERRKKSLKILNKFHLTSYDSVKTFTEK